MGVHFIKIANKTAANAINRIRIMGHRMIPRIIFTANGIPFSLGYMIGASAPFL